ncbi:hypothetical protein [Duganella violaceipulchra]|uniref:Uncharacterized protein n=1 Tax=Duganella violaceipulchra TaxID=2849652 RepID=A0AA41H5A7_9BURK|nr:hypothetical protein [Duganella violaceicalia]MBV6321948.1 hypothetical protein [Duganella violaceicalia]MCP2007057.1 hypothetical protein [Duganella violaceicalia]
MNITDTRRANLAKWVADNGIPKQEKSLFSQLRGDGSFGEKVARRLEEKYKMGAGYLDTPDGVEYVRPVEPPRESPASRAPFYAWLNEEEMHLVTLFRTTSERGQRDILDEAEATERLIQSPVLISNKS